MNSFKAASLLLRGMGVTMVLYSALVYITSMYSTTPQKGIFHVSSENKTLGNLSKTKNLGSTTSSKRIILYTGNASSWQTLPDEDLSTYFTPAEILGIQSQNCGDVRNASSNNPTWQWQGNIQGQLDMGSGPCCPNGHTYGWFSTPLQDTAPLRKVEVTSDGHAVGPFQIKALLATLHKKQRRTLQQHKQNVTSTSLDPKVNEPLTIWILGDSTSNQLFFAFLCAIIRIGATVEVCKLLLQNHYSHPLCQFIPNANYNDLDTTTFGNVDHQYVVLTSPNRHRVELHHFSDGNFCATQLNLDIASCRAYEARFLNIAREKIAPPDVFLVNLGLHKSSKEELEKGLQGMFALLSPFLHSVVWRSTTITHFPDANSTGYFETYQEGRVAGQINATACHDVFNEKRHWRQQVAQEWLDKNYGTIPILIMNETEIHMFETYGGLNQETRKLDCVHHIYTPLYYDSFFWRLSQLLLFTEQQRSLTTRHHRALPTNTSAR